MKITKATRIKVIAEFENPISLTVAPGFDIETTFNNLYGFKLSNQLYLKFIKHNWRASLDNIKILDYDRHDGFMSIYTIRTFEITMFIEPLNNAKPLELEEHYEYTGEVESSGIVGAVILIGALIALAISSTFLVEKIRLTLREVNPEKVNPVLDRIGIIAAVGLIGLLLFYKKG